MGKKFYWGKERSGGRQRERREKRERKETERPRFVCLLRETAEKDSRSE